MYVGHIYENTKLTKNGIELFATACITKLVSYLISVASDARLGLHAKLAIEWYLPRGSGEKRDFVVQIFTRKMRGATEQTLLEGNISRQHKEAFYFSCL